MKNNKTIISIVGETASGKTAAAFQLANYLIEINSCSGVDIISADSRQVYKDIAVLSGADIPEGFNQKTEQGLLPFLEKSSIRLHGVGILEANKEWSLGQFQRFALKLIDEALVQNRKVIIVGGTGLYHMQLFQTESRLRVPPNIELREKAEKMSLEELQNWLSQLDPSRIAKMNNSDLQNPRRLVRAIEQGLEAGDTKPSVELINPKYSHKIIGIRSQTSELKLKIAERVKNRFDGGAVQEVKKLRDFLELASGIKTTLGFKNIESFLDGDINEDECIKSWVVSELKYAKRQRTWWKPISNIEWVDDVKAQNMYTRVVC